MLRTTRIRTKLGLALAVPLAGLVAMAGFEVVSAVRAVDTTRSDTTLATSAVRAAALVAALQDERDLPSVSLAGFGEDVRLAIASDDEARERTDGAAAALRVAVNDHGADAGAAYGAALKALAAIDQLRGNVDEYVVADADEADDRADEVFTRYSSIIDELNAGTASARARMEDVELRGGVAIVHASSQQTELRARMAWLTARGSIDAVSDVTTLEQQVASLRDQASALDAEIRANAAGPYAAGVGVLGAGPFDDEVDRFLDKGTAQTDVLLTGFDRDADTSYGALRSTAATILADEADATEAAALARQWGFGGLALALFVLAPIVTWVAARSITKPLASLRTQAEEMAGEHLPTAVRQILDTPLGEDVVIPKLVPISVRSNDEVAEVAAALSAVQTSALDLAVEQAVLRRNISDSYINLGRRNQNLLGRQLDFITELERNETDPDTLEGLFRLDHLATRMRRNAESLLVLAGVEPPRQWAAPVKAADVVRAALGEVEDYHRVVIRHLEPAALVGSVAADIAHVTAELIENALSFSPPDQQVEVKGRLTVDGYTIAISDNGFGMPADELERANRRLAGAESFTVAPSRYLGHYVAGHLASRLGVTVELQAGSTGGITARIEVPMGLVADDETDPHLNRLRGNQARAEAQAESEEHAESEAQAESEAHAEDAELPPVVEPAPQLATPQPAHLARVSALEPAADVADDAMPAVEDVPAEPAPSLTTNGLPRRGERTPDPALAPEPTPAPPATPAPAVAAAADPASAPVAGFGGLAVTRPVGPSLFTVAARNARLGTPNHTPAASSAPSAPATQEPAMTSAGLTRRVPGAQRPDLPFEPVRAADEWSVADQPPSSAEDVYSFLNSFQSGVDRGRSDALGEELTNLSIPEDEE